MEGDTPTTVPKIAEEKLKFALCKREGHSAAWSKCEAKFNYKNQLDLLQHHQQTRNPRSTSQNYQFSPKGNYPVLKPTNVHPLQTSYHIYQQASSSNQNTNTWSTNPKGLLTPEECLNLVDHFTSELLKCTSISEQIHTIAKLSLEAVQRTMNKYSAHNDVTKQLLDEDPLLECMWPSK